MTLQGQHRTCAGVCAILTGSENCGLSGNFCSSFAAAWSLISSHANEMDEVMLLHRGGNTGNERGAHNRREGRLPHVSCLRTYPVPQKQSNPSFVNSRYCWTGLYSKSSSILPHTAGWWAKDKLLKVEKTKKIPTEGFGAGDLLFSGVLVNHSLMRLETPTFSPAVSCKMMHCKFN